MNFEDMLQELDKKTIDVSRLQHKQLMKLVKTFKDSPRLKEIDLIWCGATSVTCCLATYSGWSYGINSSDSRLCPGASASNIHKVTFIDNPFKDYNHKKHLAKVKEVYELGHRPKYVTVRDIMSKEACRKAGITYYSFNQIMDWAEELQPYAENVIVIPKTNCIDSIPEKYVLGYSVPSSYGGTEVPVEAFRGRKIHLLGGAPNKQIGIISELPEEVVSIDGTYMRKLATGGNVWLTDGTMCYFNDLLLDKTKTAMDPINVMYIACSISVANFARYFHRKNVAIVEELLNESFSEDSL